MEVLETRRLRHFDVKTAQGITVKHANGKHRLKYPMETSRELLPIGPIRQFVINRIGRPYTIVELGEKWGIGERAINRIIRANEQITYELVDQILIIEGFQVWDLYPEEYEQMLEKAAVA